MNFYFEMFSNIFFLYSFNVFFTFPLHVLFLENNWSKIDFVLRANINYAGDVPELVFGFEAILYTL